MPRKSATIRDVAKLAGVGVSTVSYVLNGNDSHVSPATREQIVAAARELNYRPNAIARSMVKQKTGTIGLIITELQNPLFVPVTEGVEEILRSDGYPILLVSANDVQSEINAIELLRAQQVDGFIFMSLSISYPTDHLVQLEADDMPFIIINRDLEPGLFNQIQFDDRGAGRLAAQHLLSLGHTHIAVLCGPCSDSLARSRRRSAVERYAGWCEVLNSHNLPVVSEWVLDGHYTYEGGYEAAQQLLALIRHSSEPPTALFVANDMMAVGALRAFAEGGLRIPEDLAVVTVGGTPLLEYTFPPLTTVQQPIAEAGRVAARLLVDWMKRGKPEPNQLVSLSFDLKIRTSCGAASTSSLKRV
ncbi:MAG TPA: LacI family DNA-binding transcriptional regulator [Aggregatilineales bacterium]|nr:LacI family DNA-binding transcriptional regulator [Aggregatilineales bacterium]